MKEYEDAQRIYEAPQGGEFDPHDGLDEVAVAPPPGYESTDLDEGSIGPGNLGFDPEGDDFDYGLLGLGERNDPSNEHPTATSESSEPDAATPEPAEAADETMPEPPPRVVLADRITDALKYYPSPIDGKVTDHSDQQIASVADVHPEVADVHERSRAVEVRAEAAPRGSTFGEALTGDEADQLNFIGGTRRDRETAVFFTLVHDLKEIRLRQLTGQLREDASVLVVDFNPGDSEPLLSKAAVPEVYNLNAMGITEENGFLSRQTSAALSDALARTADTDATPSKRPLYNRILNPLMEAVGRTEFDPYTLRKVTFAPDLGKLALALSRAQGEERGKLLPDEEWAVHHALTKPFRALNVDSIEHVKEVVNDLLRADRLRRVPVNIGRSFFRNPYGPNVPGLTVDMVSMTAPDTLQATVVGEVLPSYIEATRPEIVVFADIEHGNANGLHRAVAECERLGIRAYLSAGSIPDDKIKLLLARGAYAVLKMMSSKDADETSVLLGAAEGWEVDSETVNVGGNKGGSRNQSLQEGYEGDSGVAKTKNASGSTDRSAGAQVGIAQNVKFGDVAVARSGALRSGIQLGQVAGFGSGGQRYGLHSLDTLERLGDFPPPGRDRLRAEEHVGSLLAKHGLQVGGLEGNGGVALPAGTTTDRDDKIILPTAADEGKIGLPASGPGDDLEALEPHGRLNRLRVQFGHRESFGLGGPISRDFAAWLDGMAGERGMTPEEFRNWVGLR
ncbi:MAG TPA: hypothetical protein VFT16_03635 [Candidatus Saccharimonadales bacterium]|nr:hypothetical protein [Candidatus Saccharimonadales bacterium]